MGWITDWFFPKGKSDTLEPSQQTQDGLFEGLSTGALIVGLIVVSMNYFKDKKALPQGPRS